MLDKASIFLSILLVIYINNDKINKNSNCGGKHWWSLDFIFVSEGWTKTLACFPDDERFKYWDTSMYNKLVDYLKNK